MMWKIVRSGTVASIALVVAGAVFGALGTVSTDQPLMAGGLIGAGVGLATALVACVHLAIRALFGRVPESRTEELATHSVEREVFRRAGEQALPDIFTIILGAALLAAFLPEGPTLRWIPAVVAVGAIIDFIVRALVEWKRLVSV